MVHDTFIRSRRHRWVQSQQKPVVAVVYLATMFMAILDTTVVNVALPAVGHAFGVRSDAVGSVSIAYLVSLTVFIPVSGWLGDRIGGRRSLLAAIGVFTGASLLCGTSTTLTELVVFRAVQGLGGAIMLPVGLAMLFRVYPPAERVRMSSILAMLTALAPALGPVLGGLFTTYLSWRLVFFVNLPIGAVAFVIGVVALAGHRPGHPGRLDVTGLILSGTGLGLTMYGIAAGPSQGWARAPILISICLGVLLLAAMVVAELRAPNPLVDLHLFGNRLFAATTGLYGLGSLTYLGTLFLVALFLQDARGLSAVQSGLTIFPSALGTMLASQIVTRVLYPRFGPRRVIITGLLVAAAALTAMTGIGAGTGLWSVRALMFALGFGVGLTIIPAQSASMATITPAQTGRASSLFNAAKQLGGAAGVSLLGTVLALTARTSATSEQTTAQLGAYHTGFLIAAAIALLAIPVACTVRDTEAASTMVPRSRAVAVTSAEKPCPDNDSHTG